MRKLAIVTSFAGALIASIGSASAFPANGALQGAATTQPEQVRLVCNEWGRCWRTGPRYYRYGAYGGPRAYYGHRYGYRYGPRYGYRYGGYRHYGPGVSFRFGF